MGGDSTKAGSKRGSGGKAAHAPSAASAAPSTAVTSAIAATGVQRIRELEVGAAADARNLNNIIEIQKVGL